MTAGSRRLALTIAVLGFGIAAVACSGLGRQPAAGSTATASGRSGVVQIDVRGLELGLARKGFECEPSPFYSSSVEFCAATAGLFTQTIRIEGQRATDLVLEASVKNPNGGSAPSDLLASTYEEIADDLLSGPAKAEARSWASANSGATEATDRQIGQLHLSIGQVTGTGTFWIRAGGRVASEPSSTIPTAPATVESFATGRGLSCQTAPDAAQAIECVGTMSGHRVTIGTHRLSVPGAPVSSGLGDSVTISLEGTGTTGDYASQGGDLAGGVMELILPQRDQAAAERAASWIAGRVDGNQHQMVFAGLDVSVYQHVVSSQVAEGLELWPAIAD